MERGKKEDRYLTKISPKEAKEGGTREWETSFLCHFQSMISRIGSKPQGGSILKHSKLAQSRNELKVRSQYWERFWFQLPRIVKHFLVYTNISFFNNKNKNNDLELRKDDSYGTLSAFLLDGFKVSMNQTNLRAV